jgi:ElaB/YqjD/DUF883 family membrane-anchored ribosome-binding protein
MHATNKPSPGKASAADRIADELQRGKDKIARSASATADDLAAQMRQLQGDLASIKSTIAGYGETSRTQARETASRIGATAKEAAGEFAGHARHDLESMLADFENYARQNPHYVVGGAIGLGLLLGLLLRRR